MTGIHVPRSFQQFSWLQHVPFCTLSLNRLDGCDKWRIERESEFFDYKLIEKRIQKLRESRLNGDIGTLILHVRAGMFLSFNS